MKGRIPRWDKLIDAARFDIDPKKYLDDVRGFANRAHEGQRVCRRWGT